MLIDSGGVTLTLPVHTKLTILSQPCDNEMISWLMSTYQYHYRDYLVMYDRSQLFVMFRTAVKIVT